MAAAGTGTVSATVPLITVNASDTGELALYFNLNSDKTYLQSTELAAQHALFWLLLSSCWMMKAYAVVVQAV